MRFDRSAIGKHLQRTTSKRRLAAAQRHIDKQKLPLFPQLDPKQTAAERVAEMDEAGDRWIAVMRQYEADMWRQGRRLLFSQPAHERRWLTDQWNSKHWLPGRPEYFLDFLHGELQKEEKRAPDTA